MIIDFSFLFSFLINNPEAIMYQKWNEFLALVPYSLGLHGIGMKIRQKQQYSRLIWFP